MQIRLVAALACALGVALLASSARAVDDPQAASPPSGMYTLQGAKTCLQCHNTPDVTEIMNTPMGVKGDSRTPFAQHECESCHGPSEQHANGHGQTKPEPAVVFAGPHTSPVEVRNQVCLGCHQAGLRMNWQGSQMQQAGVACTDCHKAHAAKDPMLVKLSQPQVCITCHEQQRAETFLYSHHPIREGKVVCSDCHNPHGSPGPKLLREFTVNETCYKCHADKRGPFLWEHQPVRDACTNCHTPHGSTEARLFKERMNFLCSSCHSAVSNNSGGAFGGAHSIPGQQGGVAINSALANQRRCVSCHSQIHGSNSPNGAFFFR